jgi:hypothetical protein
VLKKKKSMWQLGVWTSGIAFTYCAYHAWALGVIPSTTKKKKKVDAEKMF